MEALTKLASVYVISTAVTEILEINYCSDLAAIFGKFMQLW
jgi:hypothetical protein